MRSPVRGTDMRIELSTIDTAQSGMWVLAQGLALLARCRGRPLPEGIMDDLGVLVYEEAVAASGRVLPEARDPAAHGPRTRMGWNRSPNGNERCRVLNRTAIVPFSAP
jgi:hypothetical protein